MDEFVDIPGYEGFYAVNKNGDIWSYYLRGIMKQKLNCRGYCNVGLRKRGTRKWHMVHRLVAKVFIPNPENKPDINHIDCIKTNNFVENLEWVTASENMQHAKLKGRVNTPEQQNKIRKSCGYVTMEQAKEIRKIYKTGKYSQRQVGEFYGVSEDVIYHIVNNHTYKERLYA